ncbi:MAG: aldo/keto reductase [Candidatus Methylomirabilales bacterium]
MSHEAVPPHTNRLIHETSPYLLQHAHNPVDWYAWGDEALRRAKEEHRPILLSIGYSTCHWCHVMERESFEDEAIAALMNRHFVCIKVDREERPDLDEIYMAATLALNRGQGGWPMTVFLTPDQQPFFAGTYFPPTNRYGRPGFATLLTRIAEIWQTDPDSVRHQAAELTEQLRQQSRPLTVMPIGEAEIAAAVAHCVETFDATHGGFGPAPKFPAATKLSFLLRYHQRTGDAPALHMVRTTLDSMARGGMYDQIGGGFSRYSTDERWLVPHFEKMLYDNALLTRTYLEAFQVTGDPLYRRIATEVLDYILWEMTAPEGGFYSATDADSEGEEGKFFVWTPREIEAILGAEEARRFCAYYDITARGNWEGKSIPNVRRTLDQVAAKLEITAEVLQQSLDRARPKVYDARRRRVPPGLDDKILTAWNGLMISGMADGYRVLGEPRYLDAGARAADFLLGTLVRPDGRLLRTYRAGKAHLDAYLEDYAYLAEALIDLYEAGGAARYLTESLRLVEILLANFTDAESGAFYTTARDHESLIVRQREGTDGAIPSGNATAASALARLSFHLDREDLQAAAQRAITAYGKQIGQFPHAFAKALAVVDLLLEGPVELALVGSDGEPGFEALRQALGRHFLPNRILAHHDPATGDPPPLPLLEGKRLVNGQAALYVCQHFACQVPITDPALVGAALTAPASADKSRRQSVFGTFLPGSATPAGTRAYTSRFTPLGYVPLGSTDLSTSKVGFGGYRIDDETAEHREALEQALVAGCNLIDTSTNYTDGGSERCVGAVLGALVRAGKLRREEVIVVSKIGYVQGTNMVLAQEREAAGEPIPEIVRYMEGCWHCIHPEFLGEQLQRSLARLQLKTLDVCLLHNPEYFFSDAKKRGRGPLEAVRAEFYRRLRDAFAFFEGQVAAGTIRWYGVSSNTAVSSAPDPEATSLSRMRAAAREAAGPDHHFRILQVPMNLFEPGGVLERNTGPANQQTVLEAAREEGIAVLINRPLNAIVQDRMLRLADFDVGGDAIDADAQFERVGDLEGEWRRQFAREIRTSSDSIAPEDFFRWADQLRHLPGQLQNLEQWQQIEGQMILPQVIHIFKALDGHFEGELGTLWQSWRGRYLGELMKLMAEFRRQAASTSQRQSDAVSAVINPLLPAERRGESLSRKALWVLASTPGVSCVLNGMRKPTYVDDALGILPWPPLPDVLPIYQAVQTVRLPRV